MQSMFCRWRQQDLLIYAKIKVKKEMKDDSKEDSDAVDGNRELGGGGQVWWVSGEVVHPICPVKI